MARKHNINKKNSCMTLFTISPLCFHNSSLLSPYIGANVESPTFGCVETPPPNGFALPKGCCWEQMKMMVSTPRRRMAALGSGRAQLKPKRDVLAGPGAVGTAAHSFKCRLLRECGGGSCCGLLTVKGWRWNGAAALAVLYQMQTHHCCYANQERLSDQAGDCQYPYQ